MQQSDSYTYMCVYVHFHCLQLIDELAASGAAKLDAN